MKFRPVVRILQVPAKPLVIGEGDGQPAWIIREFSAARQMTRLEHQRYRRGYPVAGAR